MTEKLEVTEVPAELPEPHLDGAAAVARFALNPHGRDFVVGDIHGMFPHLAALLKKIAFDEGRDRLFSVGDLVDRGPDSDQALTWLEKPWFFACRGNHEQFAIDSLEPSHLETWVRYNGGLWWLDLTPQRQDLFRQVFNRLPLALEIETATGLVGVVHADVPPMLTWEEFLERLEVGDQDAMFYAMWSRHRIQGTFTAAVKGRVERVYCGHTPTRESVLIDNVCYLDTGAAYSYEGFTEARLTLVEIHPTRHREFNVGTNEPA